MEDYFGEDVAATYDAPPDDAERAAIDAQTDVLAEVARGGRALEFGIGTGRIAIPLAARGVSVAGIDLSAAMVQRLRAKPGGAQLDVVIGDFATARVDGEFSLAYLVFNTIMNLTSQDEQVACFANAARHLSPGGCFVVEVGVPPLRLLPPGQRVVPFDHGEDGGWAYDLLDCSTQAMSSNYVVSQGGVARTRSIPFRYVWPSELDLMARMAGMRLRDRWEDWTKAPFTHEATRHVSIWELTDPR